MHAFGKTMRNALPAIGLGLMSVAGMAAVTVATAPAAYAQKSTKEFVEPYTAATTALAAKKYAEAVASIDKAAPHAKSNQEKMAVESVRVQSYYATKNWSKLVPAIESSLAMGGLPAEQVKSYKQLLAGAYADLGNTAKAVQLTKDFVDQYGGTADQYAWLAQNSLRAKDYKTTVNYAQKAIDQGRKEGKKPKEAWHKILLQAQYDSGDLTGYYSGIEKVVLEYPSELYWRALVDRAAKDPKFNRSDMQLDMYRTLAAAGVKLKTNEQMEMAEQAMIRGATVEAEKIMEPLFKAGLVGGADDRNAERNKRMYANIQAAAKQDKAGGLDQSAAEAATKPTGAQLIATGEAFMGAGEFDKAADLIKQGLDKGQINDGEAGLARLRLGMAQFRAGQKDDARKTWAEVKSDNGAATLARNWILISRL